MNVEFRSTFAHPAAALWDFHARPGAFSRLAPPWQSLRLVSWTGGIRDGGRLDFDLLGPAGLSLRWTALHEAFREGEQFADRQLRGPFKAWFHVHRVRALAPREGAPASELIDAIAYTPPLGPLGVLADRLKLRADLARMFAWRHRRTADDLARHARFADRPRRRILVTGTTGLIGSALGAFWSNAGHEVHRLVRRPVRPVLDGSGREFRWDPDAGTIDPAAFEGVDAVVHLAGANLAERRWSPAFKKTLVESRVRGTRVLSDAIASLPRPPAVFIAASGTGGAPAGTPAVDESVPVDASTFLGALVRDWEAATEPARAATRVVNLRIGVVLGARGGVLATMLPVFNLGLGGRLGPGTQMFSWIGLDDLVGVIDHALHTPELQGPVHAVAPNPVPSAVFTAALAGVLGRPGVVPAPSEAILAAFGEMAGEALRSYDVRPAQLLETGCAFRSAEIEEALRFELGRPR